MMAKCIKLDLHLGEVNNSADKIRPYVLASESDCQPDMPLIDCLRLVIQNIFKSDHSGTQKLTRRISLI